MENKILIGVQAIGKAMPFEASEATVMDYILTKGMPAKENINGVWEISRSDLNEYLKRDETEPELPPQEKDSKKSKSKK